MSPTPIVVTGRPRCGSTLLCEQLYLSNEIEGTGELFSYDDNLELMKKSRAQFHSRITGERVNYLHDDEKASSYLDYLCALCKYRDRTLLFKLLDFQTPHAWKWVFRKQPRMIYVRRDNPIEALVSIRMAQATGVWHVYDEKTLREARQAAAKAGPIRIEKHEVMKELREDEKFHEKINRQFRDLIEIPYSLICRDFYGIMQEVWDFLGHTVPPGGLDGPPQFKISDKHLSESIQNYGELSSYLHGTRYQHFLPAV